MAADFGIAEVPLTFLGFTYATASFALVLDRITGGLTRPVFGYLSDHIGRELSIFLAFGLEGIALFLLIRFYHNPTLFVLTTGLAFFGWGAVFSLFPTLSGDLFGRKFATTNYGLLYTAKGAATLLVSLCNHYQAATQNWGAVFAFMIAADWTAALLAVCVLPPLRRRFDRVPQSPPPKPAADLA
jgi:OFA family oxalate/formate antiporter-like MFS transporter